MLLDAVQSKKMGTRPRLYSDPPKSPKNGTASITSNIGTSGNSSVNRNEEMSMQEPRQYDIFSTLIYMAPEILMMNQKNKTKQGYTKVVDWWSMGITLYKMVCGYRPFVDEDFSHFAEMTAMLQRNVMQHENYPNYIKLFQKIDFPPDISDDCKDLIIKLLNVDEKRRLGAGRNGSRDIKEHPFFKDIDFTLLSLKQLKAPSIPQNKYLSTVYDPNEKFVEHAPAEFEDFMEVNRSEDWLDCAVPPILQSYFQEWDFTSDQCMRMEAGINRVREQYESNQKVRQLIGSAAEDVKPTKTQHHHYKLMAAQKKDNQLGAPMRVQLS